MRAIHGGVVVLAALFAAGSGDAQATVVPDGPEVRVQRSTPQGVPVGSFSKDLFNFVTIVPDDGVKEPGGWQQASTTLNFVNPNNSPKPAWSCSVQVGMPLRTKRYPQISADYAAYVAATSATQATSTLISRSNEWVTGSFCINLGIEMDTFITKEVKGLGQRIVTK